MSLDAIEIGVVCSSGGATAMAAADLYEQVKPGRFSWRVVTDRECGVEAACDARNIPYKRFEMKDRSAFSAASAEYFAQGREVGCVLLFFLRLVSSDLYGRFPTLNFHPSLLPAFTGFRPVERALEAGARFLGSTLHMADSSTDGGQIVSQAVYPLIGGVSAEIAHRVSYAQKLYLCLGLLEMLDDGVVTFKKAENEGFQCLFLQDRSGDYLANPALRSPSLVQAYNDFLKSEGLGFCQIPAIEVPQ